MFCNVVTGGVAPQPLRCNRARCAATAYFPRATYWSLTKTLSASSRAFRSVEAAPGYPALAISSKSVLVTSIVNWTSRRRRRARCARIR